MPVNPDNLDAAIQKIKERRGFSNIKKGSEQPLLDRIPVKSPGIMRITKGGIPLGRLVRFWGGPSSFKTRYALEVAKEAIELRTHKYLSGLKVVLYDIEKQWESEYVSELGIPVDNIYVAETDIIEDISHEVQKLLPSAHLHILDSCSEAKSQDRLAKEAGDWDIGLNIRVWEKAWEYIMNKLDKQENTIIAIDHATQNMKTKKEKARGGKEIEHHSSLSMHFKQTSWLYYDDEGMLQTEDKLKEKGILGIGGQKEADGIELVLHLRKHICDMISILINTIILLS